MKKVVLLSATILAGIALVGCGKTSSSSNTGSTTGNEMTEQYTKAEYAVMAYMKTGDISAKDLKKDADNLTLKHKGNKYTITNDVQSFVCEISGSKVKVTLQDADGKKLSTVSYTKKALAKSYRMILKRSTRLSASYKILRTNPLHPHHLLNQVVTRAQVLNLQAQLVLQVLAQVVREVTVHKVVTALARQLEAVVTLVVIVVTAVAQRATTVVVIAVIVMAEDRILV